MHRLLRSPSKFYDAKSFRSESSIAYLLKRAYTLVHERAKATCGDDDLCFLDRLVLLKLHENASLTAGDLCRVVQYDPGAFTRVLDSLESRGLIVRERDVRDRRAVNLSLTAPGRKRAVAYIPVLVNLLNDTVSDFSKAEMRQFIALLNKFIESASRPSSVRAEAS